MEISETLIKSLLAKLLAMFKEICEEIERLGLDKNEHFRRWLEEVMDLALKYRTNDRRNSDA